MELYPNSTLDFSNIMNSKHMCISANAPDN